MIVIRPPRKNEGSPIVKLADEVFGVGYTALTDVDDRHLVLRVNGKFAGWVSTAIWDEEGELENTTKCLGIIDTVILHSNYRGLGLGTVLVGAATAHLLLDGADRIECFATTWSDTGICYSKKALVNNGFVVERDYPQMWEFDDLTYTCVGCKKKPCLCDATLYVRE
jgi:GNAT superfamily N-acetyltransferase